MRREEDESADARLSRLSPSSVKGKPRRIGGLGLDAPAGSQMKDWCLQGRGWTHEVQEERHAHAQGAVEMQTTPIIHQEKKKFLETNILWNFNGGVV